MTYDVNVIPPLWARKVANQLVYGGSHDPNLTQQNWVYVALAYRHLAWMIATHEQPPVDPAVLKARRLYCIINGIPEDYLKRKGGWDSPTLNRRIDQIMEILNEEG